MTTLDEDGGDEPTDDLPSKAEIILRGLLEEAAVVQKGDRIAVNSVLGRGQESQLDPGQFALVIDILAKAVGFKRPTVEQMKTDVACTFKDYGVLSTASKVAEAFVDDLRQSNVLALVHQAKCFYAYLQENSHFVRFTDQEMAWSLEKTLPHHPLVLREAGRKEIVRRIVDLCSDEEFFDRARPGLTLANGHLVIDRSTGAAAMEPHGPEQRSRFALALSYDHAADCPVFLAGLKKVLPDQRSHDALQEFLGCAAFGVTLPGDNACSVGILYGPANSGKSTVLVAMATLFPGEQICHIQPGQLGEQFMLDLLRSKRLNVLTELDCDKPFGGALFRAIASREGVTARAIRQAWRALASEAYHLFASNNVPRTKDKTTAFGRRLRCFWFPRSLERTEIDPNFRDLIKAEMPGFLNWLIAGAGRAIQRGYLAVPPEQGEFVARMQHGDDVVTGFVGCSFEAEEGARPLSTKDIFVALCRHAEKRGVETSQWTTTTHGRRIAELLHDLYGVASPKNRNGVPHYRGVKLR